MEKGMQGKSVIRRALMFFNQVYLESTSVAWPKRKEIMLTSGLVITFSIISALFFLAVDSIISVVFNQITG